MQQVNNNQYEQQSNNDAEDGYGMPVIPSAAVFLFHHFRMRVLQHVYLLFVRYAGFAALSTQFLDRSLQFFDLNTFFT